LTAGKFTSTSTTSEVEVRNGTFTITTNVGQSYTTTIYAKKGTGNFLRIRNLFVNNGGAVGNAWFNLNTGVVGTVESSQTASMQDVGNGWYRCILTGVASLTNSFNSIDIGFTNTDGTVFPSTSINGYIWGAQLVEGTDALPYQLTETRLNTPRVDFSLGGCPNLLLEPQRTNLMLYSEEFNNATWTKANLSVTANSTTSPSGVINADTLTADGLLNVHAAQSAAISFVSGTTYTASIYAKKGTNNFIQLTGLASSLGLNVWANFDLNNGVVGSVGSSTTASIINVGNGWYRCVITGAAIAAASQGFNYSIVTSASAVRGENNSLSTSVFLWGAQVEAGAYPTTYIPTTSASVTRNQDTFQLSNVFTNNLISSAGGTWFVDLRDNQALIRDITLGGIFINTGTSSTAGDGFSIRNASTALSRIMIAKYVGGSISILFTTISDTSKIAIKWNGTTADVFVNGVKVVTATSFTATAMENLRGEGQNRTIQINSMALWNTPLTDDELEVITGEGFDTYALMASNYNYILQ
jgi:hypothetical protein